MSNGIIAEKISLGLVFPVLIPFPLPQLLSALKLKVHSFSHIINISRVEKTRKALILQIWRNIVAFALLNLRS